MAIRKMMNVPLLRVALVVIILSFSSATGRAAEPPSIIMHRSSAGELDKTGWAEAKSTEGKFSVRLPNVFNDFSTRAGESQNPVDRMFVVGTVVDGVKFAAAKISYLTPDAVRQYYEKFVSGETFPKGKRNVGEYKGFPFVDITVSDDKAAANMRVLLIGQSIINLTIEGPLAKAAIGERVKSTFFESLIVEP
jgi:hypothetical protein